MMMVVDVVYQHVNDNDPNGEVTIINANSSSLKDNQTNYSAIDCEILGLKIAVESNAYYLYGAAEINVFTDANAMEGIFQKNLGDIENKRIQRMVGKLMPFNFRFHHIPGKSNKIADCFSRLTRQIRKTEHFELGDPILADHSMIRKIAVKLEIEVDDPWVEKLATSASSDFDYKVMIQHLEVQTEHKQIPNDCEMADMGSYYDRLSVVTLKNGMCLILRDNKDILVPQNEREEMLGMAHAHNHCGPEGMLDQLRGKVWWPNMAKQTHRLVNRCDPCQRLSRSMTQDKVEVLHENLFNTHPGHTIHFDFFENNGKDYLIIADKLTGYIKCDVTTNKTTEAAIECIKKRGNLYGMPFKCVADGGPGFREEFKTQLTQLNIRVVPISS